MYSFFPLLFCLNTEHNICWNCTPRFQLSPAAAAAAAAVVVASAVAVAAVAAAAGLFDRIEEVVVDENESK